VVCIQRSIKGSELANISHNKKANKKRQPLQRSPSTSTTRESLSGVVYRVRQSTITIAIKDDEQSSGALALDPGTSTTYMLFRLADDVTYRRLCQGIEKVRKIIRAQSDVAPFAANLVRMLFNPSLANRTLPASASPINLFNRNLNHSQVEAIEFALNAPGTCSDVRVSIQ
jgi:hypothetical protein